LPGAQVKKGKKKNDVPFWSVFGFFGFAFQGCASHPGQVGGELVLLGWWEFESAAGGLGNALSIRSWYGGHLYITLRTFPQGLGWASLTWE
jgi:hypothetical protein